MNIINGRACLTRQSWNGLTERPQEEFSQQIAEAASVPMDELQFRIEQALGSIPNAAAMPKVEQDRFIAIFSQGYLMARYVERLAQRAGQA